MKTMTKKQTKEQIKEKIIELNYEILTYFDDKERVRETRDKINLLLEEYLQLNKK